MGEVDELEDPVDERQPDRAERVDRARREPGQCLVGDRLQTLPDDQGERDRDDHASSDHRRTIAHGLAPPFERGQFVTLSDRSGFHLSSNGGRSPRPSAASYAQIAKARRGDQLPVPSASQASNFALTLAITSSVTSVVPACPPRSWVRMPAAAASSVAS